MNLIECANLKCQNLFEETEIFCPKCKSIKWTRKGQTVKYRDKIDIS
ncbi:MAG: hypothetical protein AABY22_21965 [Nanoarchaeota archaeon]